MSLSPNPWDVSYGPTGQQELSLSWTKDRQDSACRRPREAELRQWLGRRAQSLEPAKPNTVASLMTLSQLLKSGMLPFLLSASGDLRV